MADSSYSEKQEFIILKIAGYDAKKQTIYGVNIENGKTISIIKNHTQKKPFIRSLATEGDRLHAPVGSTVAIYGLTPNPSHPDTFRAEWATTITKNLVDEIVIAAPTTVSPVINLPNGKTQVKIRILDETPLHIDSIDEIEDVSLLAVEFPTEITGTRGCIVRTGQMGVDEAYSDNIRLDNALPLSDQIKSHVNNPKFQKFKEVAQSNMNEHSGYIEVVGYTDAINANYNDPKNDAKRAKTPNFTSDGELGGPAFSYAAVVFNKQYKNITQVVPLPALKQIKNVVGLVGSHSKVDPASLPYFVPKKITDVQPSNITVPPQYTESKPLDVRKKVNKQGQFTSVQVTIDPAKIAEYEHRLEGVTAQEPYIVQSKENAPTLFKGFYFKKEYLDHVSAILSDIADTPALYTKEKSGKLYVLGRTDQEPFNSALKALAQSQDGIEEGSTAFSFPIINKANVIDGLGGLLEERAKTPATIVTAPKVIEEKLNHTSTANISFKEWHEKRYGNSSKGIGDDQENVIAMAASSMGIDWNETKNNIDWPMLGEKTAHGKNNAIAIDSKHSVYVNIAYEHSFGYDTPGLSINLQNMNTHRNDGLTIQLTKDSYELYQQLVKNDNYIPKVSETPEQIEAHKEKIRQNNILKHAAENAYKAANRKLAFKYSLNLPTIQNHKVLDQKKIPEAIEMLGLKESFNPKHPGVKAALFDVYDIHGDYVGYQEVFEEKIVIDVDSKTGKEKLGNKLFNIGLSKQTAEGIAIGTHRVVGEIKDAPHVILYTESYGNAISNTLATGHPSVICLDVANIKSVIGLMQKKHPNHTHIQVADNDIASTKKGNIGMLSALDNSYNLGISIIQPMIADIESSAKISDTSDVHVHMGLDFLAQNLTQIKEPPVEAFAYHVERLFYVSDNALERQLTLTLKHLELEDGKMDNAELITLASQLLQSRNEIYEDSNDFESSVTVDSLTPAYIDKLRSKYNGVSAPTYADISIPPIAEALEQNKVVTEQPKPLTVVDNSIAEQQTNKVSPYPVTVSIAEDPRQQSNKITHISSPGGVFNNAIVSLLRSNEIPFHRKPDGETFTTDVKYSNLVNSALASLTGAPELYSTRLNKAGTSSSAVVVRGNFGDSTIREKMEVVSGKKYDNKNKGFVFESVNDYIFVKEALKHHFTSSNPIISELEAVKFSEENTDLRAGIYKIADLFNKPASAIAQSHVYMRIHNPRLASFQSPLLAALYGETREMVKGMASFSQMDGNRKLDAVMHQLKREITNFKGAYPELADKYEQHLAGALSIIEAQQTTSPTLEQNITLVNETEVATEAEATVEQEVEAEVETEVEAESEADVDVDVATDISLNEDKALQLRIANYIEVPSESTQLVSEEIEVAEELAVIVAEATVEIVTSPQEELVTSLIEDDVVVQAQSAEEIALENRLTDLYEFTKTYVDAKFDEFEFEEAIKEPGSTHYDIASGIFNRKQFIDDVSQIPKSKLAEMFGKLESSSPKYLFISVKNNLINKRIQWMTTIFNEALKTDPHYNAYGIASKFSQKTVYGLINPYIDGYRGEDVTATGKKAPAYDKEMLADDLLSIDGQIDITTAAGYFKVIQAEYLRNNGFTSPTEVIDYSKGVEFAESIRYVSPVNTEQTEYLIIDDIVDGVSTTSLMVEGENGLEQVENVRIESLGINIYKNSAGFSEARSIAIGKERIYHAVQFDFSNGTKRSSNPSIALDARALVNRWIITSNFELEVEPETIEELVAEEQAIIQVEGLSIEQNEDSSDIAVAEQSTIETVFSEDPMALLPPEKAFEALFLESLNASLSYSDFYSEVFKDTGTLFNKNPYVIDGELDKIAVKQALKNAGFNSPKAMYDGIAAKLGELVVNVPSLALRDTGLITEYDPRQKLSETYTKIDELLQESGVIELALAEKIITGTALSWVSNPISNVLVHDILKEDLVHVSAKFLEDTYSADAIKLLLDVNSVTNTQFNNLNTLLTQQKSIRNLEKMGLHGFLELDLSTQEEIAKEVGVNRIIGSPRDIAQAAFSRIDDVKELAILRNSQYSFIKAAITIEKSGGKIPSSAIRQLNRLLNNETLYRPVILQTIQQIEMSLIEETIENVYAHLDASNTSSINDAIANSNSVQELILRTDSVKHTLAEGSEERSELDFSTFKYQYFTGSNDAEKINITPAYYLKDSDDLISTNEPLDYSELVNGGIYPANTNATAAMFSDTEAFVSNGASILTESNGGIATIHLAKNKYIVSVFNGEQIEHSLVSSEHDDYESALGYVLAEIPNTQYTFDNIVKDNAVEVILSKLGLSEDAVKHINTALTKDDSDEAKQLATDIINKAKELNIEPVDTGDITLDAAHTLENTFLYARLNAIADFVNLEGENNSPELILLQYALDGIEPEFLATPKPSNELDEALDTLLKDLSDEDLVDVQSAQIVDESITLLDTMETQEIDLLIESLEENFEVPEQTVGEFIQDEEFIVEPTDEELIQMNAELAAASQEVQEPDALELLIDSQEEKTLAEISLEALGINKQIVSGSQEISEGDVVIGRVDGNVTFGYVAELNQELFVTPYRYQDVVINTLPKEVVVSEYSVNGTTQNIPLFALSLNEIKTEINKDNGALFFPSTNDIARFIETSTSQSVSKDNSVSVIIGNIATANDMFFRQYIDAFKTLSKLPENPQLLTIEEALLIASTTGKDGPIAASEWLDAQRLSIRESLANHLFETGQIAEMSYFGLKGLVDHEKNHAENYKIDDIENIFTINPVEIRSHLSGNVTLDKIISDVENPTEVKTLLTELFLSPDDLAIVEDMIVKGFVNTEGTVIEDGVWQDLPHSGETLPAIMTSEQVIQSTKGDKIYSRSDEVLFISTNDELEFGLVLKDTFQVDEEIVVTDFEGRAIDTVNVANTSSEIDLIQKMAINELALLTKGQTVFIGESLNVQDLIGERELSGNGLLSLYLTANKFNNEIRNDIDLLSTPKGYEVILDDNEYALSLNDDLSVIESIGKHATMSELRKAVLVAKRSNIFDKGNTNENNRTESTRSTPISTSEGILPDDVNQPNSDRQAGIIPKNEPTGSDGDNRVNENSNGANDIADKSNLVSGEHGAQSHDLIGSNNTSENIDLSSNGSRVGIDFSPNIKFTFDDELIANLIKPLTVGQTFDVNIAAIKLAKTLTSEDRAATHEEKRTLAQFRGWGGAKAIFSGSYQHSDRRTELAEWLTAEEYESARRSVLSAFYTSPVITKATWSILTRLGIKGGVGLEPSFGTGNFASTIPPEIQETSAMQARELDTLTGEIAGHIHGELVKTAGFESTNFPANHFDFSIGNIPFGDYTVFDKNHKDMSKHLIHDYFILKMLDKVKPGGFVPVLTSSGTMDKSSNKVRQEISKTADLIGAIRLPNRAFKDNSGTEALIDILVFQKRDPELEPSNTDWINTTKVELPMAFARYETRSLSVNNYFINNSEMVIGDLKAKSSRFGYEVSVSSEEEDKYLKAPDLGELLDKAIQSFPENIHYEYIPKLELLKPKQADVVLSKEQASSGKVGGYVINSKGKVAQIQLEIEFNTETLESEDKLVAVELNLPKSKLERIAALVSLKESTIEYLNLMASTDSSDEEINDAMVSLSSEYDAVVKKYKELNSRTNKSIFKEDPESGVLLSLEHYNRQEKTAKKADLFTERTVFPNKIFENIEDSQEATLISLAEYGRIVPEYVSKLTGKAWNEITNELSGNIFENPETGGWDTENAYLSGNVREKLDAAEAAAAIDEKFKINVDYLKDVIPETIPYFEIRAKLGSDWLPPTDIQDFIKFIVTGETEPASPTERAEFKVIKVKGQWNTDISKSLISRYEGNTRTAFGTDEWDAGKLIDAALNNSPVKVYHPTAEDGTRTVNTEATANAQAKFDLVKESFKSWLWTSESRAVRLEDLYNRLRNAFVEPKFDGSKIEFNGLSPYLAGEEFNPREKQRNAVMRYLTTGKCLFIHDVGVGKSFTLLASIMKGHEVGRHNKPILAVPKSVFPQMQSLALAHYPNAKVLMLDAVKTTNPKDKAVIINKIAMNNWDIIILPHTVLPKLDVPLEFKLDLIEEELTQIEQTLSMLDDEGFGATSLLTRTQKKLENERAKLERDLEENDTYDALNIAELGIDAIFVDEADEFVNLKKITTLGAIKGVGSAQSARATALHRITEYLHREVKDAGVVLATGTDIRNNMADLYTLMRFTDPTLLESSEVMLFDDFVGSFGDIQTQFEIAPEGSGYIEVTRLNKFINIPELLMMYRQVADVVTAEQAGVKRPVIEEIHVKGEQCEYLEAYMGVLAHRAEQSRNGNPVFENDNLLAITGGGRKSSLSMNLIDSDIPYNMNSKVAQCITNVSQVYKDNVAMNPSQIIFSDLGVPNKDGRFDLYNQIKEKLVEQGIPADKVVFARDFNTDIRKQDLQDRMNSGDIAVCIGSTENMGVGKNVQKRLAAIHDLSIPWRYRDMVQRLGRIERFGNLFPNAKRFIYITEDSFDLFILQKVMQKAQITLQAKLSPRDSVREFIDDVEPKHSDIMALGTSNPIIQQALEMESKIIKLEIAEKSFHKSLISLRSNKNDALKTLDYVGNRIESLNKIIDIVKGKPVTFGELEMKTEKDIATVAKALNKAIKASIKADGQRKFKVGKVGDADIVIDAKFNGNFVASIETKDFKQEIAFSGYLKLVVDEMTNNLTSTLEGSLDHATETKANYTTKIENLNAQSTSSVFPQAEELQDARVIYRDLEVQKASLLNDAIEIVNPIEKFESLIGELKQSTVIDMKRSGEAKDLWEPNIDIKIEPVA
jgi:N12 class adenine-specific DNA methylase